jgi:hypothetical protein
MALDLNGRPYAKIGETHPGTELVADGDFTCLPNGATRTVKYSSHGLYIDCAEGRHYLEGQIEADYYIGLHEWKAGEF